MDNESVDQAARAARNAIMYEHTRELTDEEMEFAVQNLDYYTDRALAMDVPTTAIDDLLILHADIQNNRGSALKTPLG